VSIGEVRIDLITLFARSGAFYKTEFWSKIWFYFYLNLLLFIWSV